MTQPAVGRRCAVLGSPVGHSLSPALHRAAYAALGLSGWTYEAIDCDEAGLASVLDSCGPQWAGLSLTMPLKQAVLPLLTEAEPLVTEVGAANTLIFANGGRQGHNTDVAGMVTALAGWSGRAVGPVLILGAGGTACAALAALRMVGLNQAAVAVRDLGRTAGLVSAAARLGMRISCCDFPAADVSGTGLIISTVPGAAADVFAEKILAAARPPVAVLDVVYHPWPTRLALAASQSGAMLISGFELLLHQAARQVELMTGRPAPLAAMREAGQDELDRRISRA